MENYQEKLNDNQEHGVEARKERIRLEALEAATGVESKSNKKVEEHPSTSRRGPIGKKQREKSFVQTMNHVQSALPTSSRIFSRIIHNGVVEKTSDFLGSTVARPDAILAGAFTAFILTLLTYTVAKTIGYSLSGFETIAAFIIGWLVGI